MARSSLRGRRGMLESCLIFRGLPKEHLDFMEVDRRIERRNPEGCYKKSLSHDRGRAEIARI